MKRLAASVILFAFGIVFFLEMMWRSLNPYGGFTIYAIVFGLFAVALVQMMGIWFYFETKEVLPQRMTVDRARLHSLRSVLLAPSP